MNAPRMIHPPAGALACANCTAWSNWDSVTVGQDGPGGFRVIGRKPTGQCRANPPSINPDAIGPETAMWPIVGSDDWCKRFELRAERGEVA